MQIENMLRGSLRAALLACVLMLIGMASAFAEILDELDVRAEGNDAVVGIRFAVRVQYLSHAPLDAADLVDISFALVSSNAQQTAIEEYRRLRGRGALPDVTVTYPVQLTVPTKRLKVHFSRRVKFRVRPGRDDNRTIEIVIVGAGQDVVTAPPAAAPAAKPVAPAPAAPPVAPAPAPPVPPAAPPAAPAARDQQFAITLQTFPTGDMRGARPVPSQFQDFTVFSSQTIRNGQIEYELNLGYFATQEEAERARRQLAARFPNARIVDLAARREETLRAAAEAPPAPPKEAPPAAPPKPAVPPTAIAKPPVVAPTPPPVLAAPDTDIDKRAAELMTKGREALSGGNNEAAIELLNQLLILPPNRHSQDAQELVGIARERSGELAKAKAEYELYLRLFPDGEGAKRVRERLATLESTLAAAPAERRAPVERPTLRTFNGNVSQFYYGGRSKIESAFNTPTTPDRETLSSVDQSALVTSVDLNGRIRTTESDTRLVLRDTYTWSFLEPIASFNRLNAAYVDYRGLQNPWSGRLGRQVGLTGGVPARFDGAMGGFNLSPKWRVNAAGGQVVEYPKIDSTRYFYGLNIDFENLAERWHGNVYAVNQTVDGTLDRRAVGTELRYFHNGQSLYSLVDYDVSYNVFNVAMLQGTLQTSGGTVLNALIDRRRAPTLSTTNAILGQPTSSIKTLLQTVTEDQLRQQALDITATATQGLLGFTTPVHTNWQVGLDARLTNVGALPATTINNIPIPAQPATGNIWSYAAQAIGSRLYSTRDINVFSGTYLTSATFNGQLYSYNNVSVVYEDWTLQPSVRYYTQKDTFDVRLQRITPGLRLTYRFRQNIALESEYAWEKSRVVSPTVQEDSVRQFWYLGYRLDI